MAVLNVLKYPDRALHNKAQPVDVFDDTFDQLVSDMVETMYAEEGIGLAATQVGESKQLVVIDVSKEKDTPLVLVNAEIVDRFGSQLVEEACLSVPGVSEEVERAEAVQVKALDQRGNPFELEASELLSVCIQHELDHLDGLLFIQRLSRMKQNRILKKTHKTAKLRSAP